MESETKLIQKLAEAYAFLYDLRTLAITRGDRTYVLMTHGIEETIDRCKQEYPKVFQRYFNAARDRAKKHQNAEKKEVQEKPIISFTSSGKSEVKEKKKK